MENNSLEKIINKINALDGVNYSVKTDDKLYNEFYTTYKELGKPAAIDFLYKVLNEKSDYILTSSNLNTVSGFAKIISYINLRDELKNLRKNTK